MMAFALLVAVAMLAVQAPAQDGLPIAVADGRSPTPVDARHVAITLRFDTGVPDVLEVVQLTRQPGQGTWRVAATARLVAAQGTANVTGTVGEETLLVIRSPQHAGYLLDGPFHWPAQPSSFLVRAEWRRTLRGEFPSAGGSLMWVAAEDSQGSAAPFCSWMSRVEWECVGVPLGARGVVTVTASGEVRAAMPAGPISRSGVQRTQVRISGWGRMVVVVPEDAAHGGEAHASARRLVSPRARPQSLRLEEATDSRVRVDPLGGDAFWISGSETPDAGWLELKAAGHGTERLDLPEVAAGPSALPLRVRLERAQPLSGHVLAARGAAAPGAVVTVYRFPRLEHEHAAGNLPKSAQKRVAVAETRTDGSGGFHFDGMARERYEIIAMHQSLGRAQVVVDPDGRELEILLRRPSRAVGRVLRDGAPAPGVQVTFMPAIDEFASAADVTELRGGEAVTDDDGWFSILLASRGSGELRVGDDRAGVRRVPLGPVESLPDVVQVGTIELDALPPVMLALDGAGSCELLMTGPDGKSGLSVIKTSRVGPSMFQASLPEPGRWHVVAACGPRERAVVPAVVDVPARGVSATIRLGWP